MRVAAAECVSGWLTQRGQGACGDRGTEQGRVSQPSLPFPLQEGGARCTGTIQPVQGLGFGDVPSAGACGAPRLGAGVFDRMRAERARCKAERARGREGRLEDVAGLCCLPWLWVLDS